MLYGYYSQDIINNQLTVAVVLQYYVFRIHLSLAAVNHMFPLPMAASMLVDFSYPGPRLGTHVHWAVGSLKPSAEVGLLTRTSLSSDAKSAASVQNVAKFRSKVGGSNIDPVLIFNYM